MTEVRKVSFLAPAEFIPEHEVTACVQCGDFLENGGPFNDWKVCDNDRGLTDRLINPEESIPDWCPRLVVDL